MNKYQTYGASYGFTLAGAGGRVCAGMFVYAWVCVCVYQRIYQQSLADKWDVWWANNFFRH